MQLKEIWKMVKDKNIKDETLALACGVTATTVYRWRRGLTMMHPHYLPYLEKAVKAAK